MHALFACACIDLSYARIYGTHDCRVTTRIRSFIAISSVFENHLRLLHEGVPVGNKRRKWMAHNCFGKRLRTPAYVRVHAGNNADVGTHWAGQANSNNRDCSLNCNGES